MDPVSAALVAGLLGGLAIARFIIRLHRTRRADLSSDESAKWPLSSDVINAARIRVAGVGGLGLVAMALVVAWFVPRIGQTLIVGMVLGAALAMGLIVYRRRIGPMPSSGRRPGANTILSIDRPLSADDENTTPPPAQHVRTDDRFRHAI
jgi:hypothetical protein